MPDTIKAIIFDWGGVCCKEGEPFASAALQKKLYLTPEEIAQKVYDIYIGNYIGKYDVESFWRTVMDRFQLEETSDINPDSLQKAYLESYSIYGEVMAVIIKLKEKYQIGLLSNLTPGMRDHIKAKHDLGRYFEAQVYSCDQDVKAIKPEVWPYQNILEKLTRKPEECLFVDNSRKNTEAAEKLGMQILFFENPEKFLIDIKKYLN